MKTLGIATPGKPTPVFAPQLLLHSTELARELGLSVHFRAAPEAQSRAAILWGGNSPEIPMFATRYGGFQFGHWAGQLGDGRALTFEHLGDGKPIPNFEIQLKGAGPTAFSRRGDGRAVLRSTVREFLASEAMHHLGIPTARALAVVTTGESVIRDMFYDGNPKPEPGAILTRVAKTFLRPGHFELLAAEPLRAKPNAIPELLGACIALLEPDLDLRDPSAGTKFFKRLCIKTAHLMAEWMRVGFVHGVMNTDNLSMAGITLDYGPFGFLDVHELNWTPNTTDAHSRRYTFGNQPGVAAWNLARLAEALSAHVERLEDGLEAYASAFTVGYVEMMGSKLGLPLGQTSDDRTFLADLDHLMSLTEIDRTIFFRNLARFRSGQDANPNGRWLEGSMMNPQGTDAFWRAWDTWARTYRDRATQDARPTSSVIAEMNRKNPYFILRNYLLQEALEREDWSHLQGALLTPYEENPQTTPFFKTRPEWARNKAGCSALSCSS